MGGNAGNLPRIAAVVALAATTSAVSAAVWPPDPPAPPAADVVVVFEGDSITSAQQIVPNIPEQVREMHPDWLILNQATPGADLATIGTQAADQIAPHRARPALYHVLPLWAGSNDTGRGTPASVVLDTYRAVSCHHARAGWIVIVGTMLPRSDVLSSWEGVRQSFNSDVRTTYPDWAHGLFDPAGDARIGDYLDNIGGPFFLADRVHPALPGLTIIAGSVEQAIRLAIARGAGVPRGCVTGTPAPTATTTPTPPAITTGLVAGWRMDETTGDRLDAIGSHDLAATNATTATGYVGAAVQLPGNGSARLETADAAGFDPAGGFSVAAWVKLDDLNGSGFRRIIGQWAGGAGPAGWSLYYELGRERVEFTVSEHGSVYGDDVTRVRSAGPMVAGQWHFVAARYRPGQDIAVYVDGVERRTLYVEGVVDSLLPLMVGATSAPVGGVWKGALDEVAFWNRPLEAVEFAAVMASGW